MLQKRVFIDLAAVTERNKSLSSDQLVMDPRTLDAVKTSHLTSNDTICAKSFVTRSGKAGSCERVVAPKAGVTRGCCWRRR